MENVKLLIREKVSAKAQKSDHYVQGWLLLPPACSLLSLLGAKMEYHSDPLSYYLQAVSVCISANELHFLAGG